MKTAGKNIKKIFTGRLKKCSLYMPYHVAEIVGICVVETVDGDLSEICLRLGVGSICWICSGSWIAPNHTTQPGCPHVDQLASGPGS
jgi:hypothetical protein